ncbi:DinB superfamily protein [Psychrobacillus sp. OK028]|uniref:DinB family protein n=1 Tax=Psychrobacillus sp. OK028 TaxID=1884359 RepID=UPI000881D69F|nr:DinB family protein [Psychrobacillus sp. OK028]SDN12402.1 DinB superfamily protein [Psychrobacillus sp. OK028]
MEQTIFQHMQIVRGITEKSIQQIPEELADIIPPGFTNNIRWNFGHIAYIQEKLVFGVSGEKMTIPKAYEFFFSAGTKPTEWIEIPPSFAEISDVLIAQKQRIREYLPGNLQKRLPEPFTNKGGITFHTLGETFLFSFYHEALHMETIKRIYRAIKN